MVVYLITHGQTCLFGSWIYKGLEVVLLTDGKTLIWLIEEASKLAEQRVSIRAETNCKVCLSEAQPAGVRHFNMSTY